MFLTNLIIKSQQQKAYLDYFIPDLFTFVLVAKKYE